MKYLSILLILIFPMKSWAKIISCTTSGELNITTMDGSRAEWVTKWPSTISFELGDDGLKPIGVPLKDFNYAKSGGIYWPEKLKRRDGNFYENSRAKVVVLGSGVLPALVQAKLQADSMQLSIAMEAKGGRYISPVTREYDCSSPGKGETTIQVAISQSVEKAEEQSAILKVQQAEAQAKARAESLAKAEEQAKARAESLARAEAQARARAESLAKAEAQAKAKAESLAKAEAQAKAQAESLAKAEAETLRRSKSATSAAKPKTQLAQTAVSITTSDDPDKLVKEIDLKITLYSKIASNLPQTDDGYKIQKNVLNRKIEELRNQRESLAASYLSKYNTPIYPVNINLGTTAFRYSEIFPSIPYYIPGTKEVGEFLVQPVVSNKGQLTYEFTFLDPSAKYNKEREQIVVVNTDMGSLIDGLDKVREWTETAEQQNVRRRFEKVASCFPKTDCGVREVGKASTEVVFQIYEDGSTSGKLQRVKGEFVSGYNMSVESTILLGAYLKYMRDIGEQEFKVGSMSEKDLDSMFK